MTRAEPCRSCGLISNDVTCRHCGKPHTPPPKRSRPTQKQLAAQTTRQRLEAVERIMRLGNDGELPPLPALRFIAHPILPNGELGERKQLNDVEWPSRKAREIAVRPITMTWPVSLANHNVLLSATVGPIGPYNANSSVTITFSATTRRPLCITQRHPSLIEADSVVTS